MEIFNKFENKIRPYIERNRKIIKKKSSEKENKNEPKTFHPRNK